MPFTKQDGSPIDFELASEWTKNYREANPDAIRAHFFGSDTFNNLLAKEGAVGIRIYHGLDNEGNARLVLVAARSDMRNILSINSNDDPPFQWDDGRWCPSDCPGDDDGL